LRLGCRCDKCVNPSDGQKNFSIADIPTDISIRAVELHPDSGFSIRWNHDVPGFDEDHVSEFTTESSTRKLHMQGDVRHSLQARPVHMWDSASYDIEQHTLAFEDFMDDRGLSEALHHLWETGLVFVKTVPREESMVETLAERIGVIRNTFYGKTWDVRSKPQAENVAYTNRFLGYHMDLLYMKEPPGIQLLHCLDNTCTGGESFFADTFTALYHLERQSPGILEVCLREPSIRYEYFNAASGHHYMDTKCLATPRTMATCVRLKFYHNDPSEPASPLLRAVDRVHWSPPFVGTTVHQHANQRFLNRQQISARRDFREVMSSFSKVLDRPELRVETRLDPGTCAIFDNLRIVHARKAFDTSSGSRWLRGAYLDWQDFFSKANQLSELMPEAPFVANHIYQTKPELVEAAEASV
jgi:alpha-ketoglutarate-dependent taurine dioxygenase